MEYTYNEFIQKILNTRGRFSCGDEYHERHHIVPRCMNGTDDKNNLIDLFAKEHYEAHKLLALENPDNKKLAFAWWMMSTVTTSDNRCVNISSEEYEAAKRSVSLAMSGKNNPMYNRPSPMLGTHLTDEQKQHLREINLGENNPNYGKPKSEETRKKMRDAQLGKTVSNEARKHMSEAHIGKMTSKDHPKARCVAQYDLDGNLIKIWDSAADVERAVGINRSSIARSCKGDNKKAGNYQFRYAEIEVVDKISPYLDQRGRYQIKTIAQCDKDWNVVNIWNGASDAQQNTGINRAHISDCCNGKRQTAGGYRWKILDKNKE